MVNNMKLCSKCNELKPLNQFSKDKYKKSQITSACKNCRRRESGRWKEIDLKRFYGITKEQYNKMLQDQDYSCAICKRHTSELNRTLSVDHDHNTGKVRGLLCVRCNTKLGILEDENFKQEANKYLIKDR